MFQLPPVFPRTVPEHRHLRSWTDARLVKQQLNTQNSQMREEADQLRKSVRSHQLLLQVVKTSVWAGLREQPPLINGAGSGWQPLWKRVL